MTGSEWLERGVEQKKEGREDWGRGTWGTAKCTKGEKGKKGKKGCKRE